MFNVSNETTITGEYHGTRNAIASALWSDKTCRNTHYTYYGPKVTRGETELLLNHEWKKIRFREECGWATEIEFL